MAIFVAAAFPVSALGEMSSSPVLMLELVIRKLFPLGSMPSVLGDVPGALIVTWLNVTLLVLAPLKEKNSWGELVSVRSATSTVLGLEKFTRLGPLVLGHQVSPCP